MSSHIRGPVRCGDRREKSPRVGDQDCADNAHKAMPGHCQVLEWLGKSAKRQSRSQTRLEGGRE